MAFINKASIIPYVSEFVEEIRNLGICPREMKAYMRRESSYMWFDHSNIIHNSQKLRTIQMFSLLVNKKPKYGIAIQWNTVQSGKMRQTTDPFTDESKKYSAK